MYMIKSNEYETYKQMVSDFHATLDTLTNAELCELDEYNSDQGHTGNRNEQMVAHSLCCAIGGQIIERGLFS